MKRLTKLSTLRWVAVGLLCGILSFSAQAQAQTQTETQNSRPARPGMINYVEGQATMDGQELHDNSVGSAELQKGQVLNTQTGRVEVLLTPGVFLRVDDNSEIKMISPDLADTEVALDKGRAMVEVTDISKDNDIRIDLDGTSTKLLKRGLYDFDAPQNQVRVFDGKAEVYEDGHKKATVDGDHEVTLNTGGKLKAKHFDTKEYADSFYRWSGLRSGYLAEADVDTAQLYVNGGAGWVGPGWYWDPWFSAYTFIPGNGIFYSPFGWGFYSPFAIWGSPYFYGGWYGHGHPHHFSDFHEPYGHGFEPRGGFHVGGFHGGGFHGGGGGFHGGGGGGRR